jgi:hypothetical protein
VNNAPPKRSRWQIPMVNGWLWHHFHNYNDCKTEEFQMHKMHEQRGWIIWCPHLLREILEIWHLSTLNWKHLPCLAKENLIGVKV